MLDSVGQEGFIELHRCKNLSITSPASHNVRDRLPFQDTPWYIPTDLIVIDHDEARSPNRSGSNCIDIGTSAVC